MKFLSYNIRLIIWVECALSLLHRLGRGGIKRPCEIFRTAGVLNSIAYWYGTARLVSDIPYRIHLFSVPWGSMRGGAL